ncbi:MAG TPA: hypothetical protein VMH41_07030 [Mycobacteriales bacterium]|nr:hypothetical protein [Mycobacteriales bacterium]
MTAHLLLGPTIPRDPSLQPRVAFPAFDEARSTSDRSGGSLALAERDGGLIGGVTGEVTGRLTDATGEFR